MKCDSCGNVAPEGASFCPECGSALAGTASVIAAAAEPTTADQPAQPEAAPAAQPASAVEPAADAQSAEVAAQPVPAPAAQPAPAVEPAAQPASAPVNPYAQPAQPTQPVGQANPYAQPTDQAGQTNPYAQDPTSANAWAASQHAANPSVSSQQPCGQPQGAPAGGQYGAAPGQVYYPEGCISAALSDIRGTHNWFGSAFILGLINCVPILNFVSQGYLLNWAREVPFGGKTQMPKKYFSGKNFEIGFYFFLISLVFALVTGIMAAVIGWVPIIGWLALLVISFGANMFVQLLGMRMAMMQQLGDGFSLGKAWQMIRRNWTGLFCAAVVPGLVASVFVFVVMFVASLFGMGAIAPMAMLDPYAFGSSAAVGMLGAFGILGALIMLVIAVLCLIVQFFASLVAIRAVAHWVGRYAPEWASEASYRAAGYGASSRM